MEVYFNRSKIDLYCIFTTYMTSVCEKKKLANVFIKFRKETVYRSQQIPGGKLSRYAEMKFNFLMQSDGKICPCCTG